MFLSNVAEWKHACSHGLIIEWRLFVSMKIVHMWPLISTCAVQSNRLSGLSKVCKVTIWALKMAQYCQRRLGGRSWLIRKCKVSNGLSRRSRQITSISFSYLNQNTLKRCVEIYHQSSLLSTSITFLTNLAITFMYHNSETYEWLLIFTVLWSRGMHVRYNQVIHCIEEGLPLLIENLPEDIDAVMDPVLGKQTIKRGRTLILKMGDTEVEYNPSFRWDSFEKNLETFFYSVCYRRMTCPTSDN